MIILDIDKVLAMYNADECQYNKRIYKMYQNPPFHLVNYKDKYIVITHRNSQEARIILNAVGFDKKSYNLISADHIFIEMCLYFIKGERSLKMSKNCAGRIVDSLCNNTNTINVMLEDKIYNLINMLNSNLINYGMLVPTIEMYENNKIKTYNIHMALSLANLLTNGHTQLPFNDYTKKISIQKIHNNILSDKIKLIEYADARNKYIMMPRGKLIFILPLDEEINSINLYDTGITLIKRKYNISSFARCLNKTMFNR